MEGQVQFKGKAVPSNILWYHKRWTPKVPLVLKNVAPLQGVVKCNFA